MDNVREHLRRWCVAVGSFLLAAVLLSGVFVARLMGHEVRWVEPNALPENEGADGTEALVLGEEELEYASVLFPGLVVECAPEEYEEPQVYVSPVLETIDAVYRFGESFVRTCVAGINRQ